jgi:hypothetical protein
MECEYNRNPYKSRLDNYSGHEHLTVSMQPRKYSKNTFKLEFGELEDAFKSTRKTAILDYEEFEGLLDTGPRDCAYSLHLTG